MERFPTVEEIQRARREFGAFIRETPVWQWQGHRIDRRKPADAVLWLIEVADSSLPYDRRVKLPLYSEPGSRRPGWQTSPVTRWRSTAARVPTATAASIAWSAAIGSRRVPSPT